MISFYKWKRQVVFILLGLIPVLLFMITFFPSLKTYKIEGIVFHYIEPSNLIISLIVSFVSVLIIIILGNRWLRHAFTRMLEGKGLLTFILDSTGLINTFITKIMTPKMVGEFDNKKIPDVEDTYDTDLLHRLVVPKDAGLTQVYTIKQDEKTKELTFSEPMDALILPKTDDKYDKLFGFENRPVLIFNKVMDKYLSRDLLAKEEKDIEIKHNALNVLKKILETDIQFRNFGRYMGENIRPMKKGFFSSGIGKIVIWVAIIALIVFVLILFIPGFLSAGSNLSFP